MENYGNYTSNSGVIAFELGDDYIKVKFKEGTYLYTYNITGKQHVEQMKALATAGKGLSTYISKYVRDKYEMKL